MAGLTTGPMAGNTVLVTGGIGKATAIGLAAAGAVPDGGGACRS